MEMRCMIMVRTFKVIILVVILRVLMKMQFDNKYFKVYIFGKTLYIICQFSGFRIKNQSAKCKNNDLMKYRECVCT